MKTLNVVLIILSTLSYLPSMLACSCDIVYFCDYLTMDNDDEIIVVKGEVIDDRNYSSDNQAVYLKVLSTFRSDVEITDTIKIFGSDSEAGCEVNVFSRFRYGHTVYLGLRLQYNGEDIGFTIDDPEASIENYWKFKPLLCGTRVLRIEDGMIKGAISDGVFEYPEELFENSLGDCPFVLNSTESPNALEAGISIFPNPSANGAINIRSKISISQVNLYDLSARLILSQNGSQLSRNSLYLNQPGIFFLEIIADGKRHYEKVIVSK